MAIDNKDFQTTKVIEFKSNNDSTLISFNTEIDLVFEKKLKDIVVFKKGMQPYEKGKGIPEQTREMMNRRIYHSEIKIDESYRLLLKAANVQKHLIRGNSGFIKYGENLAAKRDASIFRGERILMNRILSNTTIDAAFIYEDDIINNSDIFNLIPIEKSTDMRSVLAIVTSKLCSFFFRSQNINLTRKAYPKLNVGTLEKFPIPDEFFLKQELFTNLIAETSKNSRSLYEMKTRFSSFLYSKYNISKISRKLQNWQDLTFGEFLKELNKAIKTTNKQRAKEGQPPVDAITKTDEFEWLDLFEQNKKKAQELQSQITGLEQQIDAMVYELYGLTEEEVKIVEGI